jgi:hypothetical protein
MNPRTLPHLAWLLVAVIAYAAGYSGRSAGRGQAVSISEPAGKQAGVPDASGVGQPKSGAAVATDALTGEQARARTFEVLSVANRVQRMRALCDLIPTITGANWREVLDGVSRLARTEGRTFNNTPEFHMILEQIGHAAGTEALNDALNSKRPDAPEMLEFMLKGLAAQNPKEALAWYGQLPPDRQAALTDRIVEAIALADPAQSLEMAFQTDKARQDRLLPIAMNAAFQQFGFRCAEEVLQSVRWRTDVPDDSKGWLFLSLAGRRIQMNSENGKPLDSLDWFEPYIGQTFIGPHATRDMITSAAESDPAKTMGWLERNGSRFTAAQSDAAFGAMAVSWEKQDPSALSAWLGAHPDHPQRDRLASTASTQALAADRLDEAERLLNLVSDPALRAPLEAALARKQANAQNAPAANQ